MIRAGVQTSTDFHGLSFNQSITPRYEFGMQRIKFNCTRYQRAPLKEGTSVRRFISSSKKGDVILMSGGVESSTLLYHLKSNNASVYPLFVKYGQRGQEMEHKSSHWMCNSLGINLEIMDIQSVGEFFRTKQQLKLHVPIPHRNFVLLSLSLSYATQILKESNGNLQGMNLHVGLNKEDLSKPMYESGTLQFVTSFASLSQILDPKITIQTPLVEHTKQDVLIHAKSLGLDLSKTYTCMLGEEVHCGRCMQCKSRKEAFKNAAIEEPPGFYRS